MLELVVVMAIISTIVAVALPRFYHLTQRTEAIGVQGTIGTLRSALSMKMAECIYRGTDFRAWLPHGEQAMYPMRDLIDEKADNYLGVLSDSKKRGHWFDDRESHEIVYVARNDDIVNGVDVAPKQLRWHLVGVRRDNKDPQSPIIALQLQPVTTFRWTIK